MKYNCPLQDHIDNLQLVANGLKGKATKELFNKGWAVYYYAKDKQLVINSKAIDHHSIPVLSQLNYSKDIIQFCEQNMSTDDFVVF